MKAWILCAAVIMAHLSLRDAIAETLGQLLTKNSIPYTSFSQNELAEQVEGLSAKESDKVFLAFVHIRGEVLDGPVSVAAYDSSLNSVHHATLQMKHDDVCGGSIDGIQFFEDFAVVSTHINPSAGCLLVVDKDLKLKETLYGFAPVEVAPGILILLESLIHFAPVHPERLQTANVAQGKTLELYPPGGDILRARLVTEHAKHIPPPQVCAAMNDPCDPKLFDESISQITTDGTGGLTFVATQTASHFLKPNTEAISVASQSVLYSYQLDRGTWNYCEKEINQPQSDTLQRQGCEPNLPVLPDLTTADYNPFFKR